MKPRTLSIAHAHRSPSGRWLAVVLVNGVQRAGCGLSLATAVRAASRASQEGSLR